MEALLERLIQQVTQSYGDEIDGARNEYFKRCGEPFQDEPSYEWRLRNFVEWYVFDRALAHGLTPYEAYMADPSHSPEDKAAFLPFRDLVHSLFLVCSQEPLRLEDIWTGRRYMVDIEVTAGYVRGAVIECRLVPWDGQHRPTHTHVFHTPTTARYILTRAKKLRKQRSVEAWRPFLFRVNYLQLKAERYKHVGAAEIYRELLDDRKFRAAESSEMKRA